VLTHDPIIIISTAWSNKTDDVAVNQMAANVFERLNATAANLDVANRYKYIYYASAAQINTVFPGYGDKSVERLIGIQKAVDPRRIFASKGLWRGFVKLL
jgi:hypothetical protein